MLSEFHPKTLILFSRDECKQADMRAAGFDGPTVRYLLGDVRDKERLCHAFHRVDAVVHAAALKQVPTAESNPLEAIKTNILGAANVIDAATACGVERVIALSSDKAASPLNLYGATKLCADKLFISSNSHCGARNTRFSVVRYGNVVGSRGSVIPYFCEQRKKGVIPITDMRMTRFWITVDQGASFVACCLGRMRGGEIFVPKIPSMTIRDLAEVIAPECQLQIIGVRPGEKLHEVMIPRDEARNTVELEDFYVLQPHFAWWDRNNWKSGVPCGEDFEYSSNTNPHWLSKQDMRDILDRMNSPCDPSSRH
jgi:UDP-N-acetylglucosamine 4,6-dehydratase